MEQDHANETPLDPKRERLVSLLYDELSPEEAHEVRRWIEEDANLRAEWEDLRAARAFLRVPEAEAPTPEFVFLSPAPSAPAVSKAEESRRRANSGRRRFRFSAAWAFAAATVALALLLLAGFRVDRKEDGLVLHFAPSAPSPPAALLEPTTVAASLPPSPVEPVTPLQVSASEYVTPIQLRETSRAMIETVAQILDRRDETRRQEMGYLLQAFYQRLREEDENRYAELRGQIQGVGLGLLAEQGRTQARLNALVGAAGPAGESLDVPPSGPNGKH